MFDTPQNPAPRRTRRGPALLWLAGLLVAGGLEAQTAVRLNGWDAKTPQTLTYHIDVDMDCDLDDPTLFHEHDVRKLQVKIGNYRAELVRTSTIESSSEHFGPYAFAADGSLTLLADDPAQPDDQKTPPLEAVLLLRVFAGLPANAQPGTSWTYLDPATSSLRLDKIEVQQESVFTMLSSRSVGGNVQYAIDLAAELKLIETPALSVALGAPADRSPVLAQTIANLESDGNLFLFGTLLWETKSGASLGKTYSADLTYIALPFSGGTRASISRSVYRQHFVATLLP